MPDFADDRLEASSLIVADLMEPVAAKNVGTGSFVIGATKVRPRVPPADGKPMMFKRSQKMNFWMQVYNLGIDDKTHKPSATVEYNIVNAVTNKPVVHTVESTDTMGNIGDQVTLQKTLSAANLDPGAVSHSDQGKRQHLQADRRPYSYFRCGVNWIAWFSLEVVGC